MATTGIGPVKQAVVRALRDNLALKALVGSDGINEGTEPRDSDYPHVIYQMVAASREWDSTGVMIWAEFDIWSVSDSQVQSHELDQLVADSLEEKVLALEAGSGQTSLLCRRLGDLSLVDVDGAGNRIYQTGGYYRVWTDQQRTA